MEPSLQQGVDELLRDVPLVSKYFSLDVLANFFNMFSVINVAWSNQTITQVSIDIANQMELKAVKPTHCCFSNGRQAAKHPVTCCSLVSAYGDGGGVNKMKAVGILLFEALKKSAQGGKDPRNPSDEAAVGRCLGEGVFQRAATELIEIKMLERSVVRRVKKNENSNHLTNR